MADNPEEYQGPFDAEPAGSFEDLDETAFRWRREPAAVYGLEFSVRCPVCRQEIEELYVVRMYRAKVNFVSSLPRSGRVMVCPRCTSVVPGDLGAVF